MPVAGPGTQAVVRARTRKRRDGRGGTSRTTHLYILHGECRAHHAFRDAVAATCVGVRLDAPAPASDTHGVHACGLNAGLRGWLRTRGGKGEGARSGVPGPQRRWRAARAGRAARVRRRPAHPSSAKPPPTTAPVGTASGRATPAVHSLTWQVRATSPARAACLSGLSCGHAMLPAAWHTPRARVVAPDRSAGRRPRTASSASCAWLAWCTQHPSKKFTPRTSTGHFEISPDAQRAGELRSTILCNQVF